MSEFGPELCHTALLMGNIWTLLLQKKIAKEHYFSNMINWICPEQLNVFLTTWLQYFCYSALLMGNMWTLFCHRNESITYSFVDNYFGFSSNCVSFSPTSVWKFPNTHPPAKFAFVLRISSSKSNCLLNFKYRFIWFSIRWWRKRRENGAKSLVEMKIGRWRWWSDEKGGLVTGQFDCSQGWWIRQKAPPIPCWTE